MPDEVMERAGWLAHPFLCPQISWQGKARRGKQSPAPWSASGLPFWPPWPASFPSSDICSCRAPELGWSPQSFPVQQHFLTSPSAQRPPLASWTSTPNTAHSGVVRGRLSELVGLAVLTSISCSASHGAPCAPGAGRLTSFLLPFGTWHRAEHLAHTLQVSGIKKLRIRNSVGW